MPITEYIEYKKILNDWIREELEEEPTTVEELLERIEHVSNPELRSMLMLGLRITI